MANLKRTVLGIEIGAHEIRIVEMRGSGSQPNILRAGSVRLPAGAMDGPRIVQIEAVADIIRGLHHRLGCHSRSAVVGMSIQSIVTRTLAIPRVPDSELRAVLEGELAHYQILRTGTGAFDYFRLEAGSPAQSDALPSVLLMAIEDRIAQGYRLVMERAGLQMLALEPISLALFRAAYPMLTAEPATLCLAITPQRSELSILDHGEIRLYRPLVMGSNDFIQGRKAAGEPSPRAPINLAADTGPFEAEGTHDLKRTLLHTEEDDDTAELETYPSGSTSTTRPLSFGHEKEVSVIPQAIASFANEVQRSLDYYRREFPNATAIGRVILPTNDPEAGILSEWLAQSLRMEVRVVEPPSDPLLPRDVATQLEAPQGLRFLGAAGLALQALTPDWKQVPRFNLLSGTQMPVAPAERDRLTVVMIAAVGILLVGFLSGGLFYRNAEIEGWQVKYKQHTLNIQYGRNNDLQQQIRDEQTLKWIIKSNNLPMPEILDLATRGMPEGVGLRTFEVQQNGHIVIEGAARDIAEFILYYDQLVACQYFQNLQRETLSTNPETNITQFRLTASLKGTHDASNTRVN